MKFILGEKLCSVVLDEDRTLVTSKQADGYSSESIQAHKASPHSVVLSAGFTRWAYIGKGCGESRIHGSRITLMSFLARVSSQLRRSIAAGLPLFFGICVSLLTNHVVEVQHGRINTLHNFI